MIARRAEETGWHERSRSSPERRAASARRWPAAWPRDGLQLGLVARRADRLEALAGELRGAHRIEVHVLPADLTKPGAVAALVDDVATRGLDVDWLINNAGFGTVGLFHTMPVERELEEITLNVEALVELTGRLLPPHGAARAWRGDVNGTMNSLTTVFMRLAPCSLVARMVAATMRGGAQRAARAIRS